MYNEKSLDTLCAAIADVMGVDRPEFSAEPNELLVNYAKEKFEGRTPDRLFLFNPDAIAQWIYEKYPELCAEAKKWTELELPFRTVMPSVTPVCFGTFYTGAQPAVHGIQKYAKPIIRIETLFDVLIRAGKRVALIAETGCSMAIIFGEREMDYFIYDTLEEINAKAAELIVKDEYDVIVVYDGNYDTVMHKYGPEGIKSLGELRSNSETFATFCSMITNLWKHHDTLVGFAMDHGCHEIDGGCGAHGLDMEEDLNIVHLYKAYPKTLA